MPPKWPSRVRAFLIWAGLSVAVLAPIAAAATSPLLAWRDPVYIAAGFAGIVAMTLILVQPLLAAGYLTGLSTIRGRRIHRWVGGLLVVAVMIHVAGLWITSPPDVIDALTFTSPTPFSNFGVIAMWTLFGTALLAALRRKLRLRPRTWCICHTAFAVVIVLGTVIHALLIEGTMGTVSKVMLCVLLTAVLSKVVTDLWWPRRR